MLNGPWIIWRKHWIILRGQVAKPRYSRTGHGTIHSWGSEQSGQLDFMWSCFPLHSAPYSYHCWQFRCWTTCHVNLVADMFARKSAWYLIDGVLSRRLKILIAVLNPSGRKLIGVTLRRSNQHFGIYTGNVAIHHDPWAGLGDACFWLWALGLCFCEDLDTNFERGVMHAPAACIITNISKKRCEKVFWEME